MPIDPDPYSTVLPGRIARIREIDGIDYASTIRGTYVLGVCDDILYRNKTSLVNDMVKIWAGNGMTFVTDQYRDARAFREGEPIYYTHEGFLTPVARRKSDACVGKLLKKPKRKDYPVTILWELDPPTSLIEAKDLAHIKG